MNESFKTKLARGDLLIGTMVTLPSPEISEIYSFSGFDWLFVDLEHSALRVKDAQTILQAACPQTSGLIRVPAIEEARIKRALEIGSDGIIIPQVKTAAEAAQAVQLCRYPPEGLRSVGIARAQGYGEKFQEYISTANDHVAVVIQIENEIAVNNIDEIIKIPGIDCLYIGPYDLSASMGKPGQTTDSDVQEAIRTVKEKAQLAHIPLGVFGADTGAVKPYIQDGYTLITVGIDVMMIGKAARSITDVLK